MLAVSFGSSGAQAGQNCIRPIAAALQWAFPEHELRCAYSSRSIINRLWGRGEVVESETEALLRLRAEGFAEIAVMPVYIIRGAEYEWVRAAAGSCWVSEVLLENEEDLTWMAEVLCGIFAEEGRPLLVMGHGSGHVGDESYSRLRERLPEGVYLACVEGENTLEALLPELESLQEKNST